MFAEAKDILKRGNGMSKLKKIVLSLGVAVIMLMALVVGTVFNVRASDKVAGSVVSASQAKVKPANTKPTNTKKPGITYQPGEVQFKAGPDVINYSYEPSINAETEAKATAYEYCFGSTMTTAMAVSLKQLEVNTQDVKITYAYSTTKLNKNSAFDATENFNTQTIATKGSKIYVYILVQPTNANDTVSFTTNPSFTFGEKASIKVVDNVTNKPSEIAYVKGQTPTMETLPTPEAPAEGYYFDAWFLDKDFTQLADDQTNPTQGLYARYHNATNGIMRYDKESDSYIVIGPQNGDYTWSELGFSEFVVPVYYDDGENGRKFVTAVDDEAFCGWYDSWGVRRAYFSPCSRIEYIGYGAFSCAHSVTNLGLEFVDLSGMKYLRTIGESAFGDCNPPSGAFVDLSGCSSLTTIGNRAFYLLSAEYVDFTGCTSLTTIGEQAFTGCGMEKIDLSDCVSLQTIKAGAFAGCTNLTTIVIPENVTLIEDGAFNGYKPDEYTVFDDLSNLTTIYNLSDLDIVAGEDTHGGIAKYATNVYNTLPN